MSHLQYLTPTLEAPMIPFALPRRVVLLLAALALAFAAAGMVFAAGHHGGAHSSAFLYHGITVAAKMRPAFLYHG
jgi:hypothetical protein